MTTCDVFTLNRLWHLMQNDIKLQTKTILVAAVTLIIFFALIPFHVTGTSEAYFLILYIGGFIITSHAFNDLHDRQKAHSFLILPCSNLERFLNKWLLTSISYAMALLVIYYLFSWLSVSINLLIFNNQIYPLDIFQTDLWLGIGKYIILQSIVLLGAIIFKKHTLLKTALVIGCFFLIFSLFSAIIAWSFCPNCMQGLFMLRTTLQGAHFVFWLILAPICWYLTYLRLTKYELK